MRQRILVTGGFGFLGGQERAFTHVRDIAEGLVKAMVRGRRGEIYNLGNPRNCCSILELAEEVLRAVPSESRIVFVDPKTIYGPLYEEANDKFPDAEKARDECGWTPRYRRQDVIAELAEYMRGLDPELLARVCGFG